MDDNIRKMLLDKEKELAQNPEYQKGLSQADPNNHLRKIAESGRKKSQQAKTQTAPKKKDTAAQNLALPMWPEDMRGVPNGVLRSALFGVIKRGRRAYIQRQKLAANGNISVLFSGPRLDQGDLDVWEQCLHMYRKKNLDEHVIFNGYTFLRKINRATGRSNLEWLKGSFLRLMNSAMEIKDGPLSYAGPLILHYAQDEKNKKYAIKLNPNIVNLYRKDSYTNIEFKQRKKLHAKPLAQWLHSFYSTHTNPYPYSVEKIHELCGSESDNLRDFKKNLIKSLAHLEDATGWRCHVDENNLLHVKKHTQKTAIGTTPPEASVRHPR